MKKKITLAVLAAIVVFFIVNRFSAMHIASEATLREVANGQLIGFEDAANTYAWLGVPFAKPPVGELRWRAPRPADPWQGVREALESAAMCPQMIPFFETDEPVVVGDEDCLNLDIWSPRLSADELATAKLPVMVWIHGGANTMGTSSAIRYYNLAGKGKVIVVALQYRLGLLGWLSHPALRNTALTDDDTSSNFATLDMIEALKWVQQNIATFGGDPQNVTIFGQSAGGFQVYALVGSPLAKGLFHRAIVQSGNTQTSPQVWAENYLDEEEPGTAYSAKEFVNRLLINANKAADRQAAKQLQETMRADEIRGFLQSLSIEQILSAAEKRGSLGYFVLANIRDGYALPRESLLEVFKDPEQYNAVPMIIGSNRDEYKFWLWNDEGFTDFHWGFYPESINPSEFNRISGYFSDQWQAIGVTEPASVLAASQPGEIFTYRFDWDDQKTIAGFDMSHAFGAAHGIEVTFLFGPEAVDTMSMFAMADNVTEREQLGEAMRDYWSQFARTGEPGNGANPNLPVWRPWQETGEKKLVLDSASGGGLYPISDSVSVAALKQRLLTDTKMLNTESRCQLYAQLFWYALTTDFFDQQEYVAMGCEPFPLQEFEGRM